MMRILYLCLAIIGVVLPYAQFLPWLAENGMNVPLLVTQLFSTHVGAFFGFDVLVSAVALIAFAGSDGARNKVPMLWLPILLTCVVGVSCGLPLYLFLREGSLKRAK